MPPRKRMRMDGIPLWIEMMVPLLQHSSSHFRFQMVQLPMKSLDLGLCLQETLQWNLANQATFRCGQCRWQGLLHWCRKGYHRLRRTKGSGVRRAWRDGFSHNGAKNRSKQFLDIFNKRVYFHWWCKYAVHSSLPCNWGRHRTLSLEHLSRTCCSDFEVKRLRRGWWIATHQ